MRFMVLTWCLAMRLLVDSGEVRAGGRYFEVTYPPAGETGRLQVGVTYTLWLPEGIQRVRAVIIHQHGCGFGACKGGETAAYDLHWQALARKWDCALLGPAYQQREEGRDACRLWCDPRQGSLRTMLLALDELADQSGHPELASAPWCLWGHSGGGFWASLVQALLPQRTVAVWMRSGTAFGYWQVGEIASPQLSEAVYQTPMMLNPGVKERAIDRPYGAWHGSLAMFNAYRAKGAPIALAPDPRSGHECADSRYLAIPYFDACLALRLPEKGSDQQTLRPIDPRQAWLAHGERAEPAEKFSGPPAEASWLPNEAVARAWMEYVRTGATNDTTPPPAPHQVRAVRQPDGSVVVTWEAEADMQSGLTAFVVQRDGKDLAQVPEKPQGKFGRPLFQTMSYHDTPERPLPVMRFIDAATEGGKCEYRVISVNSVGLRSAASAPAR